jgi:MFS family permease
MTPLMPDISKRSALRFVVLIGIVSLFADMTYEGARSINGQYLAMLGANALTVGFVSGVGELVGYSLRLISGYLADRTGKYWQITIIGYVCNLLAVPLLALAGHWWIAATLMILERLGKAIRVPTRDAMLSHAANQMGMGWGFGLHEALDQTGAMLGPLIVAFILYLNGSYRESFGVLLIPALLAVATLIYARQLYPHPQSLEIKQDNLQIKKVQGKTFWIFPLIAFHLEKLNVMPKTRIPIAYAIAMGVDGFAALLFGHLYDRNGFSILIIVTLISSLFAPLVFFGGFPLAMLGITLWSIGIGAHESLMRAVIANMIPSNKRASAYGTFNMGFGIFWFLGSVLMGALYDFSILSLVIFSVFIQLLAIPLLCLVMSQLRK